MFKNLTAAVAILSALGATPVAADQTGDILGAFIGGAIIGGIVANNNHRHVQRVPDVYVYDVRPRYYEVERPRYRVPAVRYYSSPNCVMVGLSYDRYGNEYQEFECY
jgi:hypothetical protein